MSASAVLRRRLGEELRKLRRQSAMTQEQAAETLNVTVKTIRRAEAGESTPAARDLGRFLDLYGPGLEHREELLELCAKARKRGGWWSRYRDLYPGPYIQLEAEAREVREYQVFHVPGLLQTEEYMRAALAAVRIPDPDRHVEVRLRRQQRVMSGDLALRAVIDETVLYRLGTPDVARHQLEHIVEATQRPNISLRVLPFDAGTYPRGGQSFVVLSFRSGYDPDVAMAEIRGGEHYFDDAEEVMAMNATFDELGNIALSDDQSEIKIKENLEVLVP